ncbi:MAG: DUF1003 domain-containing protein [Actinobacteria bacterium]|nr:DUF1003 domain-containing protein [Actinomycetota bacterium]
MADPRRDQFRLDQPREAHRRRRLPRLDPEDFGVLAEKFARGMGTAQFLIYMTIFVTLWLAWNTLMPPDVQFDPRELNYTLLTLILSLQASYAAPLILLAQNRQDDRDRVGLEQDRARDERNLADTEYLTREVASLRIAMRDMATRDFLRSELRDLVDELAQAGHQHCPHCGRAADEARRSPAKKAKQAKQAKREEATTTPPRPTEPDPIVQEARARLSGERRDGSSDPAN